MRLVPGLKYGLIPYLIAKVVHLKYDTDLRLSYFLTLSERWFAVINTSHPGTSFVNQRMRRWIYSLTCTELISKNKVQEPVYTELLKSY